MINIHRLLIKHEKLILLIISIIVILISFTLSFRRYQNYEFGKFDLGNMAQMVYNTTRLKPMIVTDQFGTNMPRSGMSHVDPILMIFAPIYLFINHPMLLVFLQHILLVSVIFPLFKLIKNFSTNIYLPFLFVILYLTNTILGYTLVWTAFHGISFVSPMVIWLIYYLERNFYLTKNPSLRLYIGYWSIITLLLSGKEQVGITIALGAIFLFKKNWKLSIQTAIYSLSWSTIAFFVIIPSNSHLRQESIQNLVQQLNLDSSKAEAATKDNFFLKRYEYLGDSYTDVIVNLITKPGLVYSKTFTEDKLQQVNYIFGSTGYIQTFNPFWLISLPDHLINFLAKTDDIYSINNHRSTIIFIINIISLIYLIKYIKQKWNLTDNMINFILLLIICNSIFISYLTKNPLISPFLSRIAQADNVKVTKRLPENSIACMDTIVELVNTDKKSQSYSGPDYIGAHTANKNVNALFPANFRTADLLAIDMYDTKAIAPLGYENDAYINKRVLARIFKENLGQIIYNCDKISLVKIGQNEYSSIKVIPYEELDNKLSDDNDIKLTVSDAVIEDLNDRKFLILNISKEFNGSIDSYLPYFIFKSQNNDNLYSFVDYYLSVANNNIDELNKGSTISYHIDMQRLKLPNDNYEVIFGLANRIEGIDINIGNIVLTD